MATELSEQITRQLDDQDYVAAATAVAHAWNEASEFGTRHCPLPGYTDRWVKFKTSGYPFGLRRKWDEAKTDAATLTIALKYVAAWNLTGIDGQPVELPADGTRPIELVDNIEDALLMWLIRDFVLFWFTEVLAPRKN